MGNTLTSTLYKSAIRAGGLKSLPLLMFYFARFIYYSIKNRSLWFYRYYPGHYGSPLPSGRDIAEHSAEYFGKVAEANDGVAINAAAQMKLLDEFSAYHNDFVPEKTSSPQCLYHYENDMFGFADGLILYCFLRWLKPSRVIEVGSGYSSALMLDCAKDHLPASHFTFIDPYSTTIGEVLNRYSGSQCRLIRQPVQQVDLRIYAELQQNDVLFIDSSHVLKIGSDLSTILYSILPSLNQGVVVHFHDIYYPFEYHEQLLREGRAWNEIYLVHAFLQFNSSFEILFFNSFLEKHCADEMHKKLPNYFRSQGNSLWLRKVA